MNTPTNKNFRYQDSGRPIQMLTPYQGAGSSTAMSAATAPAAQPTDPVPVQQVRQQELADAFQQQIGNITGMGQSALEQAAALSPRLTQTAEDAYQAALESQNLDRYRDAIGTASERRQSAVQTTLDNLRNQAQLGYDQSRRSLDTQRMAMGLPTESTDFYRSLGDAYYRNFLPVEAQALALQSRNIESDLAAEQALKNMELNAAAQRAASARQLAAGLQDPIALQLNALGQLGSALNTTIPLSNAAYYNYLQGDDQLPALSYAPPSYNVPATYDPLGDVFRSMGGNMGGNMGGSVAGSAVADAQRYGFSADDPAVAQAVSRNMTPAQRDDYFRRTAIARNNQAQAIDYVTSGRQRQGVYDAFVRNYMNDPDNAGITPAAARMVAEDMLSNPSKYYE